MAAKLRQRYAYTPGSIFHILGPDVNQEIYALPGYLLAIPSVLLNKSATLFRRNITSTAAMRA